jgi:hypothetical protein
MAKNLFKPKKATVRKKMTILITAEAAERLDTVERQAEKAGVSFPVQEHMEESLERLIRRAEHELGDMCRADSTASHSGAVGPDIEGV